MDNLMEFQASFFCSANHIKPSIERTQQILGLYSNTKEQVLPSVFPVNTLDMASRRFISLDRIMIVFPESGWNIIALPDRIDCNYKSASEDGVLWNYTDFSSLALQKLSKFISSENILGNRLALNFKYLLPQMSSEQLKKLIRRFVIPFGEYKTNDYNELQIHLNSVLEKVVNKRNETINFVTDIFLVRNLNMDNDLRLLVNMDVNTTPDNTEYRFIPEQFSEFADCVKDMIQENVRAIEELSQNEGE